MSVPGKRPPHGYKPLKPLKGPPVPPPKPDPSPFADAETSTAPSTIDAIAKQRLLKTISAPFFDIGTEITSASQSDDQPFWARSLSMSAAAQPAKTPPALPTITKSMSISAASRKAPSPTGLSTLSEERSLRFDESTKTEGSVVSRGQSLHGTPSSGARATKPIPPPKKRLESTKSESSIFSQGQSLDGTHATNRSSLRATKPIPPPKILKRFNLTKADSSIVSQGQTLDGTHKSSDAGATKPLPPPKKSFDLTKTESDIVSQGQTLDGTHETNSSDARPTKPLPPPKKKPLPLPPKARRPTDYLTYSPMKVTKPSTTGSTTRSNGSSIVTDTVADAKSPESPSSSTSSSRSTTPSKTTPLTPASQGPIARQHPVTFARPPPKEMEYTEREHPRTAFEYLDRMRRRGDLCDVTLIVDTLEIRAHKVVLAACSQYFEQMFIGEFAEPDNQPIFIDEVEEDALIALVDFSYTARIKLTDHNIYSLFEAADLLQFSGVKGACFKYFKQQINKSNCIRTWLFAEGHNCTELMEAALRYIQCNFLDIVRGREFLNLEQPDIVARLIELEDLAISSEEQVYEAVLGWLHHEPQKRKEHTLKVMRNVRFPSMSRDYLMHIVDQESFIKEDPDCLQLLIDALASHVSSLRTTLRRKLAKQNSNYTNMQPRPASMAVEVVEIYRNNHVLGLRIMGGSDRPNHVFRQGEKSGIFILKVTDDGAAARVGKLRSGDRILRVCGTDMSSVSHEQAIRLLKTSPDPLTLLVRHEPPPPGLQELTLVTKPGEGFGFAIGGGVNGYPGNPLDETDEGIFISQVIPGGAAAQDGRLSVGMRILQVNSVSMLGKSHEEALQVLQGVLDRINLLICYGYDPDSVPDTIDTVDEFGYVGSEPVYDHSQMAAVDSSTFARSESGAASR